ncbi:MAG TPA: Calx-beta domain-containing protein, partial [Dehalococcoidia bacterium]|nr:Calx-beta domain-containing protein [Dehalococcoidia bacterium]
MNGYDNLPGLWVSAGNSTIRGLVINRTSGGDALLITSSGGNIIEGNYFGVDVAGTSILSNNANIVIQSSNNVVGGTTAAARNVVSGSNSAGIIVLDAGAGAGGNVIQGNYVGTDATGTSALGNVNGIVLAANGNIVGGAMPGAANVISGNTGKGVYITGQGNQVLGNIIGADVSGTLPLGAQDGIEISGETAAYNVIGSSAPGGGNIISGNAQFGLLLYESGGDNVIHGNNIGTDPSGVGPVPNFNGIGIFASGESIGGPDPGEGNVVAFNTSIG